MDFMRETFSRDLKELKKGDHRVGYAAVSCSVT